MKDQISKILMCLATKWWKKRVKERNWENNTLHHLTETFFQGTTRHSLSCVYTKRGTRLKNTSKSGLLHSLEKQIQTKVDTLALQCQKETHPWCLRAASFFQCRKRWKYCMSFCRLIPLHIQSHPASQVEWMCSWLLSSLSALLS